MSDIYRYSFPTEIHFGPGAIKLAGPLLLQKQMRRPLVVTDKFMAQSQVVARLKLALEGQGLRVAISSAVAGNPDSSQVEHGVRDFCDHDADSIIAIGGGAVLDVAKAVGLMSSHLGEIFDYEDGKNTREFGASIPFLMAIPTTAGTGSEVGRSTVISHPITHEKKIIFHPILLAKVVLADPELTMSLPASMTAATGMDALTHLIESFLAKGSHPMCDGIALEGIHLAAQGLVKCMEFSRPGSYDQAQHLLARTSMMHAAMMGAVAFQKGLGVNHSCAHALSTVADMHHGLANAIMLPFCMAFNYPSLEYKFERMASAAGLEYGAPDFVPWLFRLRQSMQIPANLSVAGVSYDKLDKLIEVAVQDGCHASNPKFVSRDDFYQIFNHAFAMDAQ